MEQSNLPTSALNRKCEKYDELNNPQAKPAHKLPHQLFEQSEMDQRIVEKVYCNPSSEENVVCKVEA